MPSPTDLILLKVKRAKKHIEELYSATRFFFLTQPYKIAAKRDPQTREPIYYAEKVEPVPPDIAIIAGDVIQNLRTALDHLAYQLFVISTGTGGDSAKHIYFPISANATKYKSERPGKVKGVRQDFIDAIDILKPYGLDSTTSNEGGNETLWNLHRLNQIDKHRLLVTVQSTLEAHGVTPSIRRQLEARYPDKLFELMTLGRIGVGSFKPLKQGDEFFRDVSDAEVDNNLEFTFNIAFDEPGITQTQGLLETLDKMREMVFQIIESFRVWVG